MTETITGYGTRVQVTGSRTFEDLTAIDMVLDLIEHEHEAPFTLYQGDAKGADRLSGGLAKRRGWEVIAIPADWERYGKGAGPIRNQLMMDTSRPNVLIICSNNLSESRGTKDMVGRMLHYVMTEAADVDCIYLAGCGRVVTLDVTMSAKVV